MSFLAVRRVVRTTGIPLSEWENNSLGLCVGMLNKDLVKGKIVLGEYNGPKHKDSKKYDNLIYWIKSEYGEIIAPTLFTIDNPERPQVSVLIDLDTNFQFFSPHIEDRVLTGVCPPMTPGGRRIRLFIEHDKIAYDRVRQYTKYNMSCTINVLCWIANTHPHVWGDKLTVIYDGITRAGYDHLINSENMSLYKENEGLSSSEMVKNWSKENENISETNS